MRKFIQALAIIGLIIMNFGIILGMIMESEMPAYAVMMFIGLFFLLDSIVLALIFYSEIGREE